MARQRWRGATGGSLTVRDGRRDSWLQLRLAGLTVVFGLLAVVASPVGLPVVVLLMVAFALLAAAEQAAGPHAWRLDEEGLHELGRFGVLRSHPWSTLGEVTAGETTITIETVDGAVALPRDAAHAELLLRRLQTASEPVDAAAAPAVEPEQIAAWLGIGLEGELVLGASRHERSLIGFAAMLVGGPVLMLLLAGQLGWHQWLAVLLGGGVMGLALWRSFAPVRLTPYGIYRGRRLVAHWDEVLAPLEEFDSELRTTTGSFPLGDVHRVRVLRAVRRVVEAREAGAAMPRMDGIPDTALSPAEDVSVASERGLSVAGQ